MKRAESLVEGTYPIALSECKLKAKHEVSARPFPNLSEQAAERAENLVEGTYPIALSECELNIYINRRM